MNDEDIPIEEVIAFKRQLGIQADEIDNTKRLNEELREVIDIASVSIDKRLSVFA